MVNINEMGDDIRPGDIIIVSKSSDRLLIWNTDDHMDVELIDCVIENECMVVIDSKIEVSRGVRGIMLLIMTQRGRVGWTYRHGIKTTRNDYNIYPAI